MEIDGHKLATPRVKLGYDAVGKVTTHPADDDLRRGQSNFTASAPARQSDPAALPSRAHDARRRLPRLRRRGQGAAATRPRLSAADRAGHGDLDDPTSRRVETAVKVLSEILMADHHRPRTPSGNMAKTNWTASGRVRLAATEPRFPKATVDRGQDDSSLVIAVDHNACILCDRCVRACNEVRDNNVIGRMGKGYATRIAFDLNDPMGNSSCVACGECMISCPTGALTNRGVVDLHFRRRPTTPGAESRRGRRSGRAIRCSTGFRGPFWNGTAGAVAPPAFQERGSHLPRGRIRLDGLRDGAGPVRGPDPLAAEPRRLGEEGAVRHFRPLRQRPDAPRTDALATGQRPAATFTSTPRSRWPMATRGRARRPTTCSSAR